MIILKLVLLGTQLEKLKAINVEKLQKELQEEREKNFELKEKLRQKQKSVSSKLQRYHFMCKRRCQGRSHVARLNFKMSCVGVYKCLSLIVGFAVTVAIWLREVVSCQDFILHAVATFWAMSLVGIYPGRASCNNLH